MAKLRVGDWVVDTLDRGRVRPPIVVYRVISLLPGGRMTMRRGWHIRGKNSLDSNTQYPLIVAAKRSDFMVWRTREEAALEELEDSV